MFIFLLFLVLTANIASVALRRQFREESWRSVHMAIAALVLTSSGFLVILSLYSVFGSMEQKLPSQKTEFNFLYGSLVLLLISLAIALTQFFRKPTS
jgi:TRAP-type C4-dicarboxylate transport system permease small subunit